MNIKRLLLTGMIASAVIAPLASHSLAQAGYPTPHASKPGTTLVEEVRRATASFQDVKNAQAAGYALFHGCVSGPDGGAMGLHFVNGDLVGDGKLDATRPEALLYEMHGGRMQLVAVEYLVFADAWDKANTMPPTLMGQVFNYYGSPNRYRLPANYALHVWLKSNPNGTFADWNPKVSCDEYAADDTM